MSPLISASALQASLQSVRILDCRFDLVAPDVGILSFQEEHIPGAQYIHLDRDLSTVKTGKNGRHPLPHPDVFCKTLAGLGLNHNDSIVVMDAQGGMFAARLWWMLRWVGHENVRVLDGGWAAWKTAGYAVETGNPVSRSIGTFDLRSSTMPTVDAEGVLARLNHSSLMIVDARSPDRFRGENETLDPVGGHIPGAKNRFFRSNLDANGCFKSAAVLREAWLELLAGFQPESVIHQCGSGVTACHNLLAMSVAGLDGAALYPGSWSEWCSDTSRPMVTGE
jgi:thiosulfate/3-mercaptopyruvate sulfurtransferase